VGPAIPLLSYVQSDPVAVIAIELLGPQIPILLSNASILLTEPIKLSSYEKQEISAAGGKK
jgi:hypothetical protein